MAKPHENPDDLFWRKVDKSDECWEWRGGIAQDGYGKFQLTLPRTPGLTSKDKTPQKTYRAHRYAWERTNGEIPDGLFVCHACDNPKCVRPEHMFLGTQLDNRRDAARKKRTAWGERSPNARLTNEQVREIKKLRGTPISRIASDYGVSLSTVSAIMTGRNWRNVG